jgi:dinuclear metal center YbgI/SA1388 family protein
MIIKNFIQEFEKIVSPALAWKGDNVGLIIGNEFEKIRNIVIALDVTMAVVEEAKKKKANLIISHHPLLFQPLKKICPSTRVGAITLAIIKNNINVYAAHTNLDSVRWGVNFVLAKSFGLSNITVLSPMKESLSKIAVFVPKDFIENVATAMHEAGAGMFSKYDTCSFRTSGTGTFRGTNEANPFIGIAGNVERVEEIRLEVLCETWKISKVLSSMMKAHPYEEVAYDIFPLNNSSAEYGIGAIGDLPKEISQKTLLNMICKNLGTKNLRFSNSDSSKKIRRIAVCGGSGGEFIKEACAAGADAYITADLKYHTFQEFEDALLLIDAGHFETEHLVLPSIAEKIESVLMYDKSDLKVYLTQQETNPVQYFTST